jgi:hypothetical protein
LRTNLSWTGCFGPAYLMYSFFMVCLTAEIYIICFHSNTQSYVVYCWRERTLHLPHCEKLKLTKMKFVLFETSICLIGKVNWSAVVSLLWRDVLKDPNDIWTKYVLFLVGGVGDEWWCKKLKPYFQKKIETNFNNRWFLKNGKIWKMVSILSPTISYSYYSFKTLNYDVERMMKKERYVLYVSLAFAWKHTCVYCFLLDIVHR